MNQRSLPLDEFYFDAQESERLKQSGMDAATASEEKVSLLEAARAIAMEIARMNNGLCNMDMVSRVILARGGDPEALGPASGSVFKGKHWEFTGERVRSKRIKNHARELKVWRLI